MGTESVTDRGGPDEAEEEDDAEIESSSGNGSICGRGSEDRSIESIESIPSLSELLRLNAADISIYF
jgi:hypothetical protein